DDGHASAASLVAAGLLNPITGQRFVKSWRADVLLPAARRVYRELETALGVILWRERRIRRLFVDQREQRIAHEKFARGEFGHEVTIAPDESGLWIENAASLDVRRLLEATRSYWSNSGRLRTQACGEIHEMADGYDLV